MRTMSLRRTGRLVTQIAAALFISPNTLRTHTKHIFTKLGVGSRRAAVLSAHQLGLLPPGSD